MKRLSILLILMAAASAIAASARSEVRFGNESADTTAITALLDNAPRQYANPEELTAFFARSFIGTPYAAHTLEAPEEILTVRIDSLDCTTFVETAMALAFTVLEKRSSWRDFVYNLRRIRYRGGEIEGYPSRLHYICDWAVDNKYRGNFSDVTGTFPRYSNMVRSIDFMTDNRKLYPALADQNNYDRIRAIESGYRNHKFPYIKTIDLGSKATKAAFRNGDVVALVSTLKNLDVTHMGIVVKESPEADPYLLHASSSNGVVEISSRPLAEFLKKTASGSACGYSASQNSTHHNYLYQ